MMETLQGDDPEAKDEEGEEASMPPCLRKVQRRPKCLGLPRADFGEVLRPGGKVLLSFNLFCFPLRRRWGRVKDVRISW